MTDTFEDAWRRAAIERNVALALAHSRLQDDMASIERDFSDAVETALKAEFPAKDA